MRRRQLRGKLGEALIARAGPHGRYSIWWQLPLCLLLGHHHHAGQCYCGHVQKWREELEEEADAAQARATPECPPGTPSTQQSSRPESRSA